MEAPVRHFSSDQYRVTHKVRPDQAGMRLDSFVQEYFPAFSRQLIKRKIFGGDVTIHGRPHPHRPSAKVHPGEKVFIRVTRGSLEDEFWNGSLVQLEKNPVVVFENDNLVVISKPPYMATHPAGRHLFYCATVVMEEICKTHVYSCHRLDRETSGVLVLAKNSHWANLVSTSFEDTHTQKCYFFIAHKINPTPFPVIAQENLGKDESFSDETIERLIMRCYPTDSSIGKWARTEFEKVFENDHYILGLAFPKTGRQHQIRSHAAHHGFPLLGDKIYHGGIDMFLRFKDGLANEDDHNLMQLPRQALHAFALNVPNLENIPTPFFAPLTEDLKSWISNNFNLDLQALEVVLKNIVKKKFEINK